MRFIRLNDYTWWLWFVTATCLILGLLVTPAGIWAAIGLTVIQTVVFLAKERSFKAFPVQLRVAYLVLLLICLWPPLTVLYWVPALGTYALCFFGYCLMARCLSLLPWNRTSPLTIRSLWETFTVAPDLNATEGAREASGCPGGMCSLDVQLAKMNRQDEKDAAGDS